MRQTKNIPAIALKSVSFRWHSALAEKPKRRPLAATSVDELRDESGEFWPADDASKIGRLEAVLFLAKEPLSSRKLSQYANLADGTEARTLVRRLNRKLDKAGRAFRIEEIAGGFQFVTRSKFAPWLRRLAHLPKPQRLSTPAMETLAVVAYRQPVIRADVEAIRGVSCGEILNQLLNRELIRVCGRSEELGRPYLYGTSKPFLQLFGLKSLEELPRSDTFTSNAIGSNIIEPNSTKAAEIFEVANSQKEAEEETDVSVVVELDEHQKDTGLEFPKTEDDDRSMKMEDDDYDFEDEDDDLETDDDDEEFEEEFEDDEEFEEEVEVDDDEADDDEDEDDDLETDEEEDFEEIDDEDDDDDEEDDDDDLDEDEWEEVEDEETEDDEEEEDWEEEDWEDDEEWDE